MPSLKRNVCAVAVLFALGATTSAEAAAALPADVQFDSSFFARGLAKPADISRFNHGNVVLPGVHTVDVAVQEGWTGRASVVFKSVDGSDGAVPCFDFQLLSRMGVDLSQLPRDPADDGKPGSPLKARIVCGDLNALIPGATASYDPSEQHLDVSIPQIFLRRNARDWVDPSLWDEGVKAGLVNYNFSSYTNRSRGRSDSSAFLGVDAGVNVGGWRVRHQGSAQWSKQSGVKYSALDTYVQHDVTVARAQLTIGDSVTDGRVFDGVRFRGVRLASDDRMLPNSMRGYAPVVRGTADTNAQVTIRQRGSVIYQTNVAPGPFAISDLYPSGYGGDLDVTITEADGRQRTFSVPFSATPSLLREGISRFSVTAGVVNMPQIRHKPRMVEGTWQRGINNAVTGYAGVTGSEGYGAGLVGAALNTRFGSISYDITMARAAISREPAQRGRSMRLAYSKGMNDIGTNISLAAYRYSSSGYVNLNDAVLMRDAASRHLDNGYLGHQRSRLDATLSQRLGLTDGSVYLTGSSVKYWGQRSGQVTYSAGYNNRIKLLTYGLSLQRTRTLESGDRNNPFAPAIHRRTDTQFMFTGSIPLGSAPRAPTWTTSMSRSQNGGSSLQNSIYGMAGKDGEFGYGVTATRQTLSSTNNYSANGQYQGSTVALAANVGHGGGSNQFGFNASGGAVIHAGGVTFSQQLGESIAIVHAPDAKGAAISTANNVHVDSRGYAIVPYLQPYQLTTVDLDPNGLPLDVELKETSQNTAPRAGAVVLLNYSTDSGRAVLIDASMHGEPLPFGADVLNEKGESVGVVGQASRIVARGLPDHGRLDVVWGAGPAERCAIDYSISSRKPGERQSAYEHLTATCMGVALPSAAQEMPIPTENVLKTEARSTQTHADAGQGDQ